MKTLIVKLKDLYLDIYCPLFARRSLLGIVLVTVLFGVMGMYEDGFDLMMILGISMVGLVSSITIILWEPLYSITSWILTGFAAFLAIVPIIGPIISFIGMYFLSYVVPFVAIGYVFVSLLNLNETVFGIIFLTIGIINLVACVFGTIISFTNKYEIIENEE